MSYFLCLTKKYVKVFKGFNFVCAKLPLRRAESRFGKPRSSLRRERIVTFCVVQKVTKKHVLGRAKSCRWQVFVRRRPPKQGELRTDVSKATMFQGDRKVTKAARPPEMCREAARIVAAGRKRPPQAAKKAAERQKNLSLFVRSCFLGGLIRGLENLEAPFWKDLILFVRLCSLGALIRGSQNLESPCKGERIVTFCIVQKVTKKHAGLRPATSIQISARFKILAKKTGHHHVTGRAGHCELSGYRR